MSSEETETLKWSFANRHLIWFHLRHPQILRSGYRKAPKRKSHRMETSFLDGVYHQFSRIFLNSFNFQLICCTLFLSFLILCHLHSEFSLPPEGFSWSHVCPSSPLLHHLTLFLATFALIQVQQKLISGARFSYALQYFLQFLFYHFLHPVDGLFCLELSSSFLLPIFYHFLFSFLSSSRRSHLQSCLHLLPPYSSFSPYSLHSSILFYSPFH